MSTAPTPAVNHGIVKQILSGDAVIIRGQPKGGPPPEKQVCLSNVVAPRVARRANPNVEGSLETKDEPFAWEAREFLRKKLIGKEVSFTVEYKTPGSGREYGCIYLGKDTSGENMTESLVAAGLVEVRKGSLRPGDEGQMKLNQLEEQAKSEKKGKWTEDPAELAKHVRDVTWNIDDPRKYVDSLHGKKVSAVIEHVRDGCTVRAFVLPSFHYVTVLLSGIKCPMIKMDKTVEPFADEARYFVESRVLQRDVELVLEGVSNQYVLGTVLHPKGNIAEFLLKEGFARCVDWSMGVVSQGRDMYRTTEKKAKEEKIRIWKDYTAPTLDLKGKDQAFSGKVMEVINADAIMVKVGTGETKKVFLSSVRPPRTEVVAAADGAPAPPVHDPKKGRPRPLYDVPYMFEAREFLRKKLIGKKVNVKVDYVQPARDNFPEKLCCTVTIGNTNLAEALLSRGFGTAVRYRPDDEQRSAHYDELLAAESRAAKKMVGVHCKKDAPMHRIADITGGDIAKAKQFLPFLTRAQRSEALVEYVASGSRIRLFIPRETCLVTFLVSGIQCPRSARPPPNSSEGDPFGNEAFEFTRELCLQREVSIKVEGMDKRGNFIGWLFVEREGEREINLATALVEAGLSKLHFSAENSPYLRELQVAEEQAKAQKRKIWSTHVEVIKEAVETVDIDVNERKTKYDKVVVTEVSTDELAFYCQKVDNGPKFEQFMMQLREELTTNPPVPGAYSPKKNDLCAALFEDDMWYRARVEKMAGGKVTLLYVDFGNVATCEPTRCAVLPNAFIGLPSQAQKYNLACTLLPADSEGAEEALDVLYKNIANQEVLLNQEYVGHASLLYADTRADVAEAMIGEGFLVYDSKRKERRLSKLLAQYKEVQEKAKRERKNLWRYGDITEDDAREFGVGNR